MASEYCAACHSWKFGLKECVVGHEKRCSNCIKHSKHTHPQQQHKKQQHQQQQQQHQLEFLSHRDTDTQRMNTRQRDAIITLHQNGDSINDICMKVGCVKSTVYRWLNKYNATHELNDDLRGEQQCLTYDEVNTVIHTAKHNPFITPKGIHTYTHIYIGVDTHIHINIKTCVSSLCMCVCI